MECCCSDGKAPRNFIAQSSQSSKKNGNLLDQRSVDEKDPGRRTFHYSKEIDYAAEATAGAWYEDAGRFNARFERAFADYLGVRHAISVPCCTSAIHLSLAALGIGPGHEAVVSDVTWIASAAPVAYVGATPVFADIDPLTWCLDPLSFAAHRELVLNNQT
jgi:dTDP-4-amino-4,6-dideoxygalactose transaminase